MLASTLLKKLEGKVRVFEELMMGSLNSKNSSTESDGFGKRSSTQPGGMWRDG